MKEQSVASVTWRYRQFSARLRQCLRLLQNRYAVTALKNAHLTVHIRHLNYDLN